jgi:hypothetical protein
MLLLSRAKLLVLSNELLLQLYASPIFMLEFASSVTIGSFVFLVFLACVCVCVCVVCVPIRRDGWKMCVSQRLFTHSILSTTSSSSKFRYLFT